MENINNEQTKKIRVNGKKVFIILLVIVAAIFILSMIFGAKTVESGNGWKHQIGKFGQCEGIVGFSGYDTILCENKSTHRIKGSPFYKIDYCEEHWESMGENRFKVLAEVENESDDKDSEVETQAKICAMKAVEDNLKSPSTAEFCKY